jgi:polysaccharide pyruvyl transferase WcaK-like protein
LVVPFGFYGWGNIGDEATLQGFARLMSQSPRRARVWVASQNVRHTSSVEPSFRYFKASGRDWRRTWAMCRADAVVFAGGTPIMDGLGDWPLCDVVSLIDEAVERDQPVVFIGVGTERLERDESKQLVRERIAPIVEHWTVRSGADQARLCELGVPGKRIAVAADMAWLLKGGDPQWAAKRLREWGFGEQRRLLAVNVLGEKSILARDPSLFDKIAAALDDWIESRGYFALFLANEIRAGATFDTMAARAVQERMKHRASTFVAPNDYLSPAQMMSIIGQCSAVVSMRYHFCLFAALERVPFVALKRSDKVADLCSDLQSPHGVLMSPLETDRLLSAFASIDADRDRAIDAIQGPVAQLKVRAKKNWDALLSIADRSELHRRCQPV